MTLLLAFETGLNKPFSSAFTHHYSFNYEIECTFYNLMLCTNTIGELAEKYYPLTDKIKSQLRPCVLFDP